MFSTKASKRGIKNTDNVSNKKAHTEVDDCVSEDNDTDSEDETGDIYFKKSGTYMYGMRAIGYQCCLQQKVLHLLGSHHLWYSLTANSQILSQTKTVQTKISTIKKSK